MNTRQEDIRNYRYHESTILGANCEYWYYGKASLLFVDDDQAGEYVFHSTAIRSTNGDMMKVVWR